MTIIIYYRKTQQSKLIKADHVEIGRNGIIWSNRGESGYMSFDYENYDITITN